MDQVEYLACQWLVLMLEYGLRIQERNYGVPPREAATSQGKDGRYLPHNTDTVCDTHISIINEMDMVYNKRMCVLKSCLNSLIHTNRVISVDACLHPVLDFSQWHPRRADRYRSAPEVCL